MIAHIRSFALQGLECSPVDIEVDVSPGLPQFVIVGLPDTAVSEARDRVRAAILNSGLPFPRTRVTVNLAPAHIKKAGSHFDLPIALGILLANGTVREVPDAFFAGELALDGDIRAVRAVLPMVVAAGSVPIVVPSGNVPALNVLGSQATVSIVETLSGLVSCVLDGGKLPSYTPRPQTPPSSTEHVDLKDIVGQHVVKRALEIAASGAHNMVFAGPPGAGKTMLAKALVSLLPPMTQQEQLEVNMVHSVAGEAQAGIVHARPFRAPHHSATAAAILGGGRHVLPGEISLAHHGVLFFDELPEFQRSVLESLRQPLEDGTITIRRADGAVQYPATCQYVAALNPCPCGYFGDTSAREHKQCSCSAATIERYQKKLSGPLLDRIDIKLVVEPVAHTDVIAGGGVGESSSTVRKRVEQARERQHKRQGKPNARLTSKQVQAMPLETSSRDLLKSAIESIGLSMRGYTKTVAVARTIADLAGHEHISDGDIAEALNYTRGLSSV